MGGEEDEEPKEKAMYEGQYKDGKGTYKYAKTQDIYSGMFVDGQKDVEGCYEFGADQSKLNGTWVKGVFTTGEWPFKTSDPSKPFKYSGQFENGQPVGAGSYSFPSGIIQEGTYDAKPLAEDAEEGAAPEMFWSGTPVYST